ncbi:hypothetical protein BV20DRAFT_1079467, partial [Pilatotrama ljubarskyi]
MPGDTSRYPSTPRNIQEWAMIFAEAKKVEEVTVRSLLHTHSDFIVREGACVSIKVDGSRRRDAVESEMETFASVVALAVHPRYGALVKLLWFLARHELSPDVLVNPVAADYLPTMGEMELISLSECTYAYADTIHAVIPIVLFQTYNVSLPIIDGSTHYVREDLYLKRHPQRDCYVMPPYTYTSICVAPCHGSCYMQPDPTEPSWSSSIPTLRFCQECNIWVHVSCCQRAYGVSKVSLPPPDANRPPQPSNADEAAQLLIRGDISYDVAEWVMWKEFLRLPIQRNGHRGSNWPLSFERV